MSLLHIPHLHRGARLAGTPSRRDIFAVPDPPEPDRRRQPAGNFVGRVRPEDPVGTFGNVRHMRRDGAGTFAGDPNRQRKGSFGDHDLDAYAPEHLVTQ